MHTDDADDRDGLVSACGHSNPPTAHFCDVCGVRLSPRCPACRAINRAQANFCSQCGLALDEAPPAAATAGAVGPESAPALAPAAPPRTALARLEEDAPEPLYDERLRGMLRFRRRRRLRAWALGAGSLGLLVGIVGLALVSPRVALRGAESPAIESEPQASPGATAGSMAASVADGLPARAGPDVSVQPGRDDGSPPAGPRTGGELRFVVPGEPPSYDAHREETFALIHPAAPHYNTLLRIDPEDPTGTRVVGDLATSWAVSSDRRTYVLRLRRGVKFHDGSELTSRDVRATYEKIIDPPPGITSARRGEYLQVETVQAPEPYLVAFKLRWPSPSFIHSLASPWNWIYKADILERDVRWYERNVMGTGPFVFVEHVKGSHWAGRRNPRYWDRGKPYLDAYRALFIRDDAAQLAALRSGQADIQFRGVSPAQRDELVRALGERVTVQESPWNCGLVVAINHEKAPFHDARVRRALSLALDRHRAAGRLSKSAIVRAVAGVQVPGSPFATPLPELMTLAGYRRDIAESRSEARRLLAEAGVPGGFAFVLKNRDVPMPYHSIGAWLVDEWRQVGLRVRHEVQDSARYFEDLRAGSFELSTDFRCGYVVDPDLDLYKFQSRNRSDANYGRYTDAVLDELYVRQSRTVNPEQRRRHVRSFERRLLDEEAHYLTTLQWHRIVPHSARLHGWTITPSHYLNNQLDTVWLSE
jgi:peptide/nickel transport system substrate-binding protein